jgi:peptide/nickel transport system substrate-binding protein
VAKSDDRNVHPYIPRLVRQLEQRRIDRREFLRTSTLLGLSATTAYGIVGKVFGPDAIPRARAQSAPKQGGTLKISMRVPELKNPHTYSWVYDSNVTRQVNDYLTRTGTDNITRPWLLESWEASEDLKTWTLNLRQGIEWSNGEPLVADHIIWNLERMLDPDVGSSWLGLMEGFMMKKEGDTSVLWDANAIEKVDDHTIRLNGKSSQLAIPENLFHYPALMLWPEEDGEWGVGAVGTGAFTCDEIDVGKRAVLRPREGYWGEGPYVDELVFIDHGDDPAAEANSLIAEQVHGQFEANITQLAVLSQVPHLTMHEVVTAQTGVVRMKVGVEPFDDPRVRLALRKALDTPKLLQIGHSGIGGPGEHHHVSTIHPEYAEVDFMEQDIEGAKALLAEAGYPDGLTLDGDLAITVPNNPAWEQITVQACVEMWKEIGVDATINIVPEAQYWEVWTKVPFGFTRWTHRPLGVMVLGLAYRSGVSWNETDFDNPRFEELLAEAEATLDVDERRVIVADIEKLMLEEGPIALPLWRGLFSFWDKSVKGFDHHPTSYIFAEEIWLDSEA